MFCIVSLIPTPTPFLHLFFLELLLRFWMLVWSSDFLLQFFGFLFGFSRWGISLTYSARPSMMCSFPVSWTNCLLHLWGCCISCLFYFALSLFCYLLFVYFGLSMFEAILENFDSTYIPKLIRKRAAPSCSLWWLFIAQVTKCGFSYFTGVLQMSGSVGLLLGAILEPGDS